MKHVIVGTAGHIDHGKTALVKALTGIDADRLKEEKQRGITIDIGFADLSIGDLQIGFVDVPGHERFVKNMLAGAHGLDLVMLVIAADESIMPQTREHFDICRLLNIKSGLIALTKSDLVDAELLELARAEVEDFVAGSFLENAPIIPVSSRTGDGIEQLKIALALLSESVKARAGDSIARLPIDRAFSIKGFGTVVTGTLTSGSIHTGNEVEILPSGLRARVRNLQVHGGNTDEAVAGQRTAINLQGVNIEQVSRGMQLAAPGKLKPSSLLDASLDLLPGAPRPLVQRARIRLHHGTAEVMARVLIFAGQNDSVLEEKDNGKDNSQARAGIVEPGQSRIVQLRLEEPISALPGDRFIIRSYSPQLTIGGGVIIDAQPAKHRIRDSAVLETLTKLKLADPVDQGAIFLEMAGPGGMQSAELASRIGASDEQIQIISKRLISDRQAIEVSDSPLILLAVGVYETLAGDVVKILEQHHKKQPLSLGLSREEVRERVFGGARPEIFRAVIARLADAGAVKAERDALRLSSHSPALSNKEMDARNKLEGAIKRSALQACTLEEIAAQTEVPLELARKLFTLAASEGLVTKIGDMVFDVEALGRLKSLVQARKSVSNRIDVAVFKEITGGLSRKHAIPLLEYLDRQRITRRVGNEREIL
ncbi:MAG: selenocysteine-specific translation elongation factor [Blastocatellia bacterium AA13]|nr:MAG: selenocysteine-specific translation elongation factor [Blastocatellia bacterium AA13]